MSDVPKPIAERSYIMGDIGAGARAMQGEHNSWVEGVAKLPHGDTLAKQFEDLIQRIAEDTTLDQDDRDLAQTKIRAVAESLVKAQEEPGALRRALRDAKSWFGDSASWIGGVLGGILQSEAAQATLGAVADESIKSMINTFSA